MLRHWSIQALLLSSKRAHGQFQRYPALARFYAQRRAPAIQTLDPSKLQPSDYVDLAGPTTAISTLNSTFRLYYGRRDANTNYAPFPDNTSGFLYLSSTADKPQSAWEVRFRVTDSNSPPSFQSGVDLLRPDHKPWHILVRSLGSKKYAALWGLLLQGGLVDDSLLHLRPSKLKQPIQTLNPSRLQSSDHLNLSGSSKICLSTQKSPSHVAYTSLKRRRVPFPDDACGFLYLHSPAAEPKAMWEIRFRVTDNNCPSSFKSGSDLLFPNLTPWAISIGSLQAHHPEYLPLRELLIREGLDIDALLAKMGATRPKKSTSSPLIDYSLTQRFRVDFNHTAIIVNFISFGGERLRCVIHRVFVDQSRSKPYSGSAWCRFEARSSPGSTQPDQLAIRILEMIVPVTIIKPDIAHQVPMPQEGQLIMRYTKRGPGNHQPLTLDPRPWTLNEEWTAHPVIQSILRDAAT